MDRGSLRAPLVASCRFLAKHLFGFGIEQVDFSILDLGRWPIWKRCSQGMRAMSPTVPALR